MRSGKGAVAVAVVLVAGVSSCGGPAGGELRASMLSSERPVTEVTAPAEPREGERRPPEPGTAVSARQVLEKVALQDADLPPGLVMELIPEGDQVDNQVTLDMCGADFPSEVDRTARYQRVAVGPDDVLVVNNENVRYRSPEAAATALDELRTAIRTCPQDRFMESRVMDVPPLRFEIEMISANAFDRLTDDHVLVAGRVTAETGEWMTFVDVFQRRGSVMVALYGEDVAGLRAHVGVVAQRLDELTAAEAGE